MSVQKREWIRDLRSKRKALSGQLAEIIERAKAESRNLSRAEESEFDTGETSIREIDARLEEIEEQVQADEAAAPMQRKYAPSTGETRMEKRTTMPGRSGWSVGYEAETYRPDGGNSYFRDLWLSRNYGDPDAAGRLSRNNAQQADRVSQKRAISGNAAGSGGEFVPPMWMESQFVAFARPGRITADLAVSQPLPAGTDVINLPKINTGSAVAVQTTQNSAVQQTDITTTSVGSPVVTIAGGQTLSLQLMEQSPLNMDAVILGDLAADYGVKLDMQVLSGTGTGGQATGILTLAGTNQIAYTSTTPTLAALYSKLAGAIQAIHTARFLPPTVIIMHPRRWAWAVAQLDGQNRPLVVPRPGGPMNSFGVQGEPAAQGYVGEMLGLPVYVDASIPISQGAGANQDSIIVARKEDIWLWESNVRAEAFPQTYASNMSVFVRLYNYISFQPARFPQSISVVSGTGLTTPSF